MFKKAAILVVSIIVILFVSEVVLRIIGFQPFQLPEYSFSSELNKCYVNTKMGFALLPGEYEIELNKGLKFTATHNLDSNRITSSISDIKNKPELVMLGCSYSYGVCVNDNQTYPSLIQQSDSSVKVLNLSKPGSGNTQHYLLVKQIIGEGRQPKTIVLNYANFHEERNLLNRSYQSKLYMGMQLTNMFKEQLLYPKIEIDENGDETLSYPDILKIYHPIPLRENFALMNLLDQSITNNDTRVSKYKLSTYLLSQINTMCLTNNIRFIVANVGDKQNDEIIKTHCQNNNIEYVNISPDFNKDGFRCLPYDGHPNSLAHQVYADKMISYLSESNQ